MFPRLYRTIPANDWIHAMRVIAPNQNDFLVRVHNDRVNNIYWSFSLRRNEGTFEMHHNRMGPTPSGQNPDSMYTYTLANGDLVYCEVFIDRDYAHIANIANSEDIIMSESTG